MLSATSKEWRSTSYYRTQYSEPVLDKSFLFYSVQKTFKKQNNITLLMYVCIIVFNLNNVQRKIYQVYFPLLSWNLNQNKLNNHTSQGLLRLIAFGIGSNSYRFYSKIIDNLWTGDILHNLYFPLLDTLFRWDR